MKGLVEFKNSEGEIIISCLFVMTTIVNFCKARKLSFTDFEKEMADSSDMIKVVENFVSMVYFGAKTYSSYNRVPFDKTEEEVSILIDIHGLMSQDSLTIMNKALYGDFDVVEKKTEQEVKA